MGHKRLEKVDNYHYLEVSEDGQEVKWVKHIEPLCIELTNIQAGYRVEGAHREEIFDRFSQKRDDYKERSQSTFLEKIPNNERTNPDQRIEKEDKYRYFINAEGVITNNKVLGIINEDNTLGKVYAGLEVYIEFYTQKKSATDGQLLHVTGNALRQQYRLDEYLSMFLCVRNEYPEDIFRKLQEAENRQVTLACHVEAFRSEIERSLSEPWTHQTYYIPFDSSDCGAYFGSLEIISQKKSRET
jgi:hypothetical protein